MKKQSSSKASKTAWKRVRAMKDKDIKASGEHPEADMRHIVRGIVRRGLQPVPPKASIALRLDADVLSWFKAQIRDNNPPETALTLARLTSGGESHENAMRLIGCAMAVEIFEILNNNRPFDERRYVENLRRLPELPVEAVDRPGRR